MPTSPSSPTTAGSCSSARPTPRRQGHRRGASPSTGAAIALQPDGRIVVAGATGGPNPDFAIARLLEDGTPDTDFTDSGVMTIDFFGFTDVGESVAVTDDGKIVVAGLARDNVDGYGVARLSPQDTDPTGP